ncbi:Putative carboxylesterase, type B [gamma proteobacterium HdN1]|nr:Putative carboxylesterase, type B [gamma proteobacterium HdN1]
MNARTPDPTSRRTTQTGEVIGFALDDATHAWLGIPYAAPPVGPLRWRAPKPAIPWSAAKECLEFGAPSLQLKSFMTASPPNEWNQPLGSEDCLTLNIFAPQQLPGRKLPVMLWIHGGGNCGGSSAMYLMAGNLPAHHEVIVVSLNYRLGIFGWFNHPSIFDETCSAEDRSGNFGTLDLIAALRWVKTNIAAFGGDPSNVTIFGESAGGQNVLSLYVSPFAKGLFHKAIAQSSITTSSAPEDGYALRAPDAAKTRSAPQLRGNAIDMLRRLLRMEGLAETRNEALQQIDAFTPEALRHYLYKKDAEQIISAFKGGGAGIYVTPRLFEDGVVLPDIPLLDAFADPRYKSDIPLLIGTNRDEMKLFMMMNTDYVRFQFGKIPIIRDRQRYQLDADYFSRMWKAVGADEPLQRLYAQGNRKLFCYRFDWDEIAPTPIIRPDILLGCTHAMDLPFVFRDVQCDFNPFQTFTKRNRESRIQTVVAMSTYWTNFAHYGDPNGNPKRTTATPNRLPEWLAWQPAEAKKRTRKKLRASNVLQLKDGTENISNTLVIDSKNEGGIRMETTDVRFSTLKESLRTDPRLTHSGYDRCRLYAQMFLSGGIAQGIGSIEEYESLGDRNRAPAPAATFISRSLF